MKHLSLMLMVALVGLGAGSCTDDSAYYGPPNGGYLTCQDLTTCDSCTQILGCGWCTIGNSGACVSEPNACWRAAQFEWTWEASGCPGAAPNDAGTRDAATDASD